MPETSPKPQKDLLDEAVEDGECSAVLAEVLRKRLAKVLEYVHPRNEPQTPFDTEDWHLTASVKWVAKKKPYRITCPNCGGSGKLSGFGYGNMSLDPSDECGTCGGSGKVTHPGPSTPEPPPPEEFVKYLHEAWKQYFKDHPKPETPDNEPRRS